MDEKDNSISRLNIAGVYLIRPARFYDSRGFFSEVYSQITLSRAQEDLTFVQDNHSFSHQRGTIRGLHYQAPPSAQTKLIRVVRGSILDVAVDIRRGSPTFGAHVKEVLSAENWCQMLVPGGCAHGFCTLEADTEVIYKVTDYYAPASDHGIAWNDPDLGITWPVEEQAAILSAKDRTFPRLAEIESPFVFRAGEALE